MTNEEIITQFYKYLPEITGGVWNLKLKLKDRWDDVVQNTALALMSYNISTPISNLNESDLKGLFFITLRNKAILEVNGRKSCASTYTTSIDGDEDNDLNLDYIMVDNSHDDVEFVEEYREKALQLMTEDDYNIMLELFNTKDNPNDKISTKLRNKVSRIKQKIGLEKYYRLKVNGIDQGTFKTLSDVADELGTTVYYMSITMIKKGNHFKYNNDMINIYLETNIK